MGSEMCIRDRPSPGDFVPHLDLIAVDSFLASPRTGDSDPKHGLIDMVTVFPFGTSPGPHVSGPTWASKGAVVSGTHLRSIRIWLHCSLTVTQPNLLILVFTWATPGHGDTGSHLGLTWTW